jgi:hypothetical protein
VKAVWDGGGSSRTAEVSFNLSTLAPSELLLTQLQPDRFTGRWNGYEIEELLAPVPLSVGGQRRAHGLAAFAGSEIEFDLHGLYDTFTALVGMDDISDENAAAEYFVLADGKEIWHSGTLNKKDPPGAVNVSISGAQKLTLRTRNLRGRGSRGQTDWIDPKVSRATK